MSEPIGKGDWVECLHDADAPLGCQIVAGRIYRVAELVEDDEESTCGFCGRCDYGIAVEPDDGINNWCPAHFRPIYRPKDHAFDYLLENIPEQVSVGEII